MDPLSWAMAGTASIVAAEATRREASFIYFLHFLSDFAVTRSTRRLSAKFLPVLKTGRAERQEIGPRRALDRPKTALASALPGPL